MYYYILDPHNISQRDFERCQTELQSLLTEFKISGELARVTPLRIIPDLVDTAAQRGVKTLVACGTDETFNEVLAAVKDRGFTLAFVPFAKNTQLGKILGMTDLPTSVKTIASRRIERVDFAKVNEHYFFSYLEMGLGQHTNKEQGMFSLMRLFGSSPLELKMRIDDSYTIEAKTMGALIVNTRTTDQHLNGDLSGAIGNPQDGYLDLLMIEKLGRFAVARHKSEILKGAYEKLTASSAIRCQKIEILEPAGARIYIDGKEITKCPAEIEILPGKLNMIVGKNRVF